ncbi:MAG: CoA transferase [Myxococcota bacterium]
MSDRPDPAIFYAQELLRRCDLDWKPTPRAHPRSAPLAWACSGAMALTGSPDGPPEFAAGALATAAEGTALALQALAPGRNLGRIDAPALFGERAAIEKFVRHGSVSVGGSAQLLSTSETQLVFNLPRDEDWMMIPALLEVSCQEFAANHDWSMLARLLAERDSAEILERGRLMGLAIADVNEASSDPGTLFTLHRATETRAPTTAGTTMTTATATTATGRKIRLLDLSSLWAGPLATSLLAMVGIEVLKVESPIRPDGARAGPRPFFDLLNGNKRGCALDLYQSADRALFDQLLESADVVVESARPRALAQLGFDASTWVDDKPGRIWASITGYGRNRDWIAFGDDAAMAAGLGWSPGEARSAPRFCGDAIADPLAGLHAAVLILAHLKKGRGGLLDLSLVDIAAYAAALPVESLVLPIENSPKGWCVLEEGQRRLIEPPRSRAVHASAPTLAAANEGLIRDWTNPC